LKIKVPDEIPPFISYYESLWKQETRIHRPREMESAARAIRKQFQVFVDFGSYCLPPLAEKGGN